MTYKNALSNPAVPQTPIVGVIGVYREAASSLMNTEFELELIV